MNTSPYSIGTRTKYPMMWFERDDESHQEERRLRGLRILGLWPTVVPHFEQNGHYIWICTSDSLSVRSVSTPMPYSLLSYYSRYEGLLLFLRLPHQS
jgi:hypothetical protein